VLCGEEGLCEAAADEQNSLVMSAMVGFSGVVPTLAAIQAGRTVALANKESLVSAGAVIMGAIRTNGTTLLAVDSEHSAIAQCLVGEPPHSIKRLILTASGGPFLNTPLHELHAITPAAALQHPNWTMGNKITVDSATMMNKGFEVIEAHWLFNLAAEHITVVVHPQSIVHSLVEFVDGSVKAQMSHPTMLIPIQYALTFPSREHLQVRPFELARIGALTFVEPDFDRFPCLRLAYEALGVGGSAGCVLNAANEVAVYAFLNGDARFTDIAKIVEQTLASMKIIDQPSLADLVAIDAEARSVAHALTAPLPH
jgi:1-deoxy-D-xylulose-5-phosphate reductoisomerase